MGKSSTSDKQTPKATYDPIMLAVMLDMTTDGDPAKEKVTAALLRKLSEDPIKVLVKETKHNINLRLWVISMFKMQAIVETPKEFEPKMGDIMAGYHPYKSNSVPLGLVVKEVLMQKVDDIKAKMGISPTA